MIEMPILALLQEGSLHGYELKRRLESIVGYFGRASYGSLYPMLRKLEARGYVRKITEEQADPRRITYQITLEGETYFLELMRNSDVPFTLKLLFFQSIPASDRKHLMERQRDEWTRKLEERHHSRELIAHRSVDRYRAALLARAIERLKRDIAWIQDLIEGEDRS